MNVKSTQLVIISLEEFQRMLHPIISKLEIIENKIGKTKSPTTSYYRNKDLKTIFGLSDNTILKYRDTGIIPYTYLDNIYYYPKDGFDELLKNNSNWELFKNKAS